MRRLCSGWGEIILKYISAVYLHQQVRLLKNTTLHKWLSESSALGRGNLVPRVLSYPQEREPGNEVRGKGTQQPAPRANAFAYVTLCGREGILAFPMPSIGKWYSFHVDFLQFRTSSPLVRSSVKIKFLLQERHILKSRVAKFENVTASSLPDQELNFATFRSPLTCSIFLPF